MSKWDSMLDIIPVMHHGKRIGHISQVSGNYGRQEVHIELDDVPIRVFSQRMGEMMGCEVRVDKTLPPCTTIIIGAIDAPIVRRCFEGESRCFECEDVSDVLSEMDTNGN